MIVFATVTDAILILGFLYVAVVIFDGIYDLIYNAVKRHAKTEKTGT